MNLIVIDTEGNQLADTAAASFVRMIADGMPTEDVTVGYRSRERQAELYAGWVKRLPGYNFALPPGQSRHEVGYALDAAGPMRTWMAENGRAYGWRRTNPTEPWHYEYFYFEDQHLGRAALPTPPTPVEEDDMYTEEDRVQASSDRAQLKEVLALLKEQQMRNERVLRPLWRKDMLEQANKAVAPLVGYLQRLITKLGA